MQLKSSVTVGSYPLLILSTVCISVFFLLLASMFASALVSSIYNSDLFSKMISH